MMEWIECSERMDRDVIKKDGTAVDIEYFMATHVPFRRLEFIESGDVDSHPAYLSEEQLYDKYIVNKADKHQMLIVRGTNGTGKSHLICWLYNRFVNDNVNYNTDKEKVIFLRRLGNTVRGAVMQMLDEGIVQDKDLQEKFRKFAQAERSQSEEELKTTIYTEYARKISTDSSGKVFSPISCKDISAFLHDKRVEEYMMRIGGPVDRCYQMITVGARTAVTDGTDVIFTQEDFDFPKEVTRSIKREAAEEVRAFYINDLRGEEEKIKKLVNYLNHFTSGVIQSCANITSENARNLFVNLRKSLYQEGKKLTIFIEDFTSFSIVESELITALSVESGGNYSDLCRVTSVIGITDGYYDSFRDNFKDRVTKQIRVNEESYGGENFLFEMAARYLNAIYCKAETVKDWYAGHPSSESLPAAEFEPDYVWDSVRIGEKDYTLYPFNRKSLIALYDRLKVKTPRYFLSYIIQGLFFQFANGMEYKDSWEFPELPSFIDTVTLQPPYADNVENTTYPENDKQRLKVLFSTWGDGTTDAREGNIGGINRKFLADIGLGGFAGIEIRAGKTAQEKTVPPKNVEKRPETITPKLSREEVALNRKRQDIESWFEEKKTLQYSADYNKWVGSFVVQGIAWQDEGYPADFVKERFRSGNFVDIEDSKLDTSRDRAVVVLDRTSETRTILMGLSLFDCYKNWDFDNAAYYQLVLINWLERNKKTFIYNIFGDAVGEEEHPVITWCLAAEYLQRLLYGEKIPVDSDEDTLRYLLTSKPKTTHDDRIDTVWNDAIKYVENKSSDRKLLNTYLISGSNTVMGVVGGDTNSSGKVCFYRTKELLNSFRHLKSKGWDIRDELGTFTSSQYENVRKYLSDIYARISAVVESEKKLAMDTLKAFEALVGKNASFEDYLEVVNEIQSFFANCNLAHEPYKTALKIKFDDEPAEQAKAVMECFDALRNASAGKGETELLIFFAHRPIEVLNETVGNLKEVENLAARLREKHEKTLGDAEQIDPLLLDAMLKKLEALSDEISEMEVEV